MNIAILSTAHIHTRGFLERIVATEGAARVHLIWDDVAERGQRYAAEFGARYEPNLGKAVRDKAVDGFMICVENTKHLPLLKAALPRGKPVFCDKPLATNVKELRRLSGLIEKHGSRLILGYYHAFLGEMQAVKQMLAEDAFGSVTRVRCRNSHDAAYGRWFDHPDLQWFLDPKLSGGGAFLDMGTHAVHLLRSLFGPVTEVSATIGNQSGAYPTVDDFGIARLTFASGVVGIAEAAWTHVGAPQGLEIIGSRKSLWHDGRGYVLAGTGEQPVPLQSIAERPVKVDRLMALIRGELGEDEIRADLEAAADSVVIMAAAYESSAKGRAVRVGVTRPSRAVPS